MPEWMTIPDLPVHEQERRIHLERYEYASGVMSGKKVLDCACGMGYGTDMLRSRGATALGVDIDPGAIALAGERYPESSYAVGDIYTVPLDGVEAAVCFETLEHLDDPELVIDRFSAAGVSEIIASVPIRPTVHANHWHRRDFTHDSFRSLIGRAYENRFSVTRNVMKSPIRDA
jgi:SAM-dependent methyltransferase